MSLKIVVSLVFSVFVAGCTTVTRTGGTYPPVDPSHVKVLLHQRPPCKTEEIALILTPSMWNQSLAIEAAREKAAEVGADYMMIEKVLINKFNDAKATGLALKCIDTSFGARGLTASTQAVPKVLGTEMPATVQKTSAGTPSSKYEYAAAQVAKNSGCIVLGAPMVEVVHTGEDRLTYACKGSSGVTVTCNSQTGCNK